MFNFTPNKTILLFVFLFSNIFLTFSYFFNGELGGDLGGYAINDSITLWYSLLIVLCSYCFVIISYSYFSSINISSIYKAKVSVRSDLLDYIVTFLLLVSFFFSYQYGYGRVGFNSEAVPSVVTLFNKLLVPILVAEIYLFYNFSSKKACYYINTFLFLALAVYKGYTGPILHIGFLWVFRWHYFGKLNIRMLVSLFVLAVLSAPLIRILKNAILRSMMSPEYSSIFDALNILYVISGVDNFFDLYLAYFQRVFERFELISSTYYIIENTDAINNLYIEQKFLPFYLYHWIPQTIEKYILLSPTFDLTQDYAQRAVASLVDPNFSWQMHIGYSGWLIIKPYLAMIYVLYTSTLLFLAIHLSKILNDRKSGVEQLTWYLTISYVIHGWFNEYILFIQALVVYILLLLVIRPFCQFFQLRC